MGYLLEIWYNGQEQPLYEDVLEKDLDDRMKELTLNSVDFRLFKEVKFETILKFERQ